MKSVNNYEGKKRVTSYVPRVPPAPALDILRTAAFILAGSATAVWEIGFDPAWFLRTAVLAVLVYGAWYVGWLAGLEDTLDQVKKSEDSLTREVTPRRPKKDLNMN